MSRPRVGVRQWARDYVRERARDNMVSTVHIYRPSKPTFDPNTGVVSHGMDDPVYQGIARVWNSDNSSSMVIGENNVTIENLNVSIPLEGFTAKRDDVVVIKDNPQLPSLEGETYQVTGISGGGLIGGTQILSCFALRDSASWSRDVE